MESAVCSDRCSPRWRRESDKLYKEVVYTKASLTRYRGVRFDYLMPSSENPPSSSNSFPDSVTSDHQTPEAVDAIFACLTNHRRRLLIECLSERSGPVVVEALIQQISDQEERRPAGTPRDERLGNVTLTLLHNHLPRMDKAGVVEVDHETKTVQKGDHFTTAVSLLEVI